ncbi:MAG: DNA-processing protein DprA [bacterium]|nr:DNA-processing protein DprA [bacterium]MDD5354240.1 DNA-processing protein DprA [bacterium]MDD5756073.1 DNA-processing protein DprA [bacterium]
MDKWILVNAAGSLGKARLKGLLDFYQEPELVLKCSEEELLKTGLVDRGFTNSLRTIKKHFDLDREYKLLEKHKVRIVTIRDDDYPASLRYINGAPILLYMAGNMIKEDIFAIGVVGTRDYTAYGKNVAAKLSGELAGKGVTIVSGLARGIDTFAHQSALAAKGRTIAVLGGGIAAMYPPENRALAQEIAKHGAVVSEYPMMEQPSRISFPLRNRIISGLSLGLLVVEADVRSGSLITAQCALEQGREVFAVPGNITNEYARGTNQLIKDGAKLVEGPRDIIEEISCLRELTAGKKKAKKQECFSFPADEQENAVLDLIGNEPINIEVLGARTGKSVSQLSSILLQLICKELIREMSGKNYVRTI